MNNDPQDYDDATIAAALLDEFPAPQAGYWESIDASLSAIATEQLSAPSDTNPSVIRLTDMNEKAQTPFGSRLLTRAAILLTIGLAIGGVAFVAQRNTNTDPIGTTDGSVTTLATTPTSESTTSQSPTTEPQTTTSQTSPPETSAPETAPSTSTTTTPVGDLANAQPPQVDSFDQETLWAEGFEPVGCWFRLPDDGEAFTFFGGWQGGLMSINGKLVTFDAVDGAEPIDMFTVETYTSADYRLGLLVTGERVETSIESADWPITLTLVATDGPPLALDGIMGCGV